MNQVAKDCAAELERRIDAKAHYEDVYRIERKAYIARPDWSDVADHCPEEIPVLMGMIAEGALPMAKAYMHDIMLTKAADEHADTCATNATEPSTW